MGVGRSEIFAEVKECAGPMNRTVNRNESIRNELNRKHSKRNETKQVAPNRNENERNESCLVGRAVLEFQRK